MGLLQTCKGTGFACLPGTHSKWIRFADEVIQSFSTSMTGELYAALRQNTSLARIMTIDEAHHADAFHRGVARSIDPGGLLHHLFGVRTLTLMDQLKQDEAGSYLSGLLIGHEIRAVMPAGAHIDLVGDPKLCSLYAQAIQMCGGSFTIEDEHAAARGLAAIGTRDAAAALAARWSPPDRHDPLALEWLRRWSPKPAHFPPPACSCATSSCSRATC